MKKALLFMMSVFMLVTIVGCDSKNQSVAFPSDEEIMEVISPYLGNALPQDVAEEAGLLANLGLTNQDLIDPVLYMGMPNQNTTYFCMATFTEGADRENVTTKLNTILKGWTQTSEQGYIQGNLDYEVIVKKDKVFAIMHENLADFQAMQEYLNSLPNE